jgi:ferric-dicitrate binding protein FerR (iron transport regulator)
VKPLDSAPAEASGPELESEHVSAFKRLAHEHLSGEPSVRDRQSFSRIQERLAAGGGSGAMETAHRSWTTWAKTGAVALAAVVVLGVGAWSFLASRHITYRIENAQAAADGRLLGGTAGGAVHFSDGSELSLLPGSETTVSDLTAHGGHVRVEQGTAHVAIAKKPGAAWSLLAGPYTVRVTGTAFDIGWQAAEQRFDISMQSGSVVITGPLAPKGVTLGAGQRLQAARELTVARNDSVASSATAPEPASTPEPYAPPDTSAAPAISARGVPQGPSWRDQVAHGEFATVLAEAQRRGISSTLSTASLEDLAALADAARYAHRPDLARRSLLSQRHRYPGTAQAKDAAFFLGSLMEGQPGAVEWYDRYLSESPQGSYASQALGRKLIFVYGEHRGTEARQLATEYDARYPNGPYASTARKVLAEPPGAGDPPAGAPAVP